MPPSDDWYRLASDISNERFNQEPGDPVKHVNHPNLKSFNRLAVPEDGYKLETAGDSKTQTDKCDNNKGASGGWIEW
jgi:hypothetical protein